MGGQGSAPRASPPDGSGAGSGDAVGFTTTPARPPTNKVQLAVSVLGGVGPATAYHSSVLVNGEEYFFSDGGISSMSGLASHKNPQNPNSTPTVMDMGMSHYSGSQLKAALERHFRPGEYDLLRKNCNSFSDCSLFYLVGKRLDSKYRSLEQLGAKNMGLVQAASGGNYKPNPKTDGFDLEALVASLDPAKVWKTPGQTLGGGDAPAANSAEALRAARLARFGGPSGPAASASGASSGGCAAAGGYPASGGTSSEGAVGPAALPVGTVGAGL